MKMRKRGCYMGVRWKTKDELKDEDSNIISDSEVEDNSEDNLFSSDDSDFD
jgi:hypothetical protein